MPPTTAYSFGDIVLVLVPFPFTDQSGTKRRPAVVVSVTSQVRPAGAIGEVSVKDWKAAGLIKASVVKPVLTTIEAPVVIKRLGQLKEEDQQALKRAIATIIG